MSHFSDKKTEIELFVIQNFNFEDENPYTSQVEEEGKFVKITNSQIKKDSNDNTILARSKPPRKQRE
jgi:hypothetical protein